MKNKTLYVIIAIVLVLGVYGYEHFIEEKENDSIIEKARVLKEDTNEFFLPSSTTGQVIHHNSYSLSYSEAHEQAEWVAYELKKSHLTGTNFKRPYFEIDKAVNTGAASWRNYKNSGYDRGHLCPAGDRTYSEAAFNETFLTSNISPQNHEFNSGIWNSLEQKTRFWANKYDGVFVVSGGVLKGDLKTIGNEEVAIPNYFYKVILDNNGGPIKMIAFLMPHKNSNQPLYDFVIAVDSIENLTGIDFFPQLDDTLENELEAKSDYKDWSFN